MTAPAPSNNIPTTTMVRIISQFSVSSGISGQSRELCLRGLRPCKQYNIARRELFPDRSRSEGMATLMLADGDPDPLGRCRHVDVIDLVFAPQALDDCIDDRRTGTERRGLARTLDSRRRGLAGHVMGLEHE